MQRECHQSSRSGSSTHTFSTHLRPTFAASEVPDEYAIYPREKQYLLALHVTPAVEQDRAQAEQLAQAVQDLTDQSVTLAYVDQGCTGANAREAARAQGIALEAVKHTDSSSAVSRRVQPLTVSTFPVTFVTVVCAPSLCSCLARAGSWCIGAQARSKEREYPGRARRLLYSNVHMAEPNFNSCCGAQHAPSFRYCPRLVGSTPA
jgi:L-asparaginase/Glu-tRNA(Gln) amidotransferase subunit D